MNIENTFITTDCDHHGNTITFRMIEDESGDIFWAFGHVDPSEFIAEVMNWLIHIGAGPEPGEPYPSGLLEQGVEHLWARMEHDSDERFTLVEPTGVESDAQTFPVTRVWL